jgi:hypothetical protein
VISVVNSEEFELKFTKLTRELEKSAECNSKYSGGVKGIHPRRALGQGEPVYCAAEETVAIIGTKVNFR